MGSPVWGMPTSYSSTLQLTLTLFRGNLASQDSRGIRKGSELNRDCFCQLCSHPKLGFSSAKIEPVVRRWEVGGNLFGRKKKTSVPANFQEQPQTTSLEWKLRSQIFLKRFISNEKGIQDHLQSIVNSAPVVFSHFSPLWIWIGNTLIHFDSRSNFSISLPVEKWHLHF